MKALLPGRRQDGKKMILSCRDEKTITHGVFHSGRDNVGEIS